MVGLRIEKNKWLESSGTFSFMKITYIQVSQEVSWIFRTISISPVGRIRMSVGSSAHTQLLTGCFLLLIHLPNSWWWTLNSMTRLNDFSFCKCCVACTSYFFVPGSQQSQPWVTEKLFFFTFCIYLHMLLNNYVSLSFCLLVLLLASFCKMTRAGRSAKFWLLGSVFCGGFHPTMYLHKWILCFTLEVHQKHISTASSCRMRRSRAQRPSAKV